MLRHSARAPDARMGPPKPLTACDLLFITIADENRSQRESRQRYNAPLFWVVRCKEKNDMKAIFVEPFLIVASSLLWILVLPFAALVYSGLAISHRVAVA